jgi:ATP-dependent DNA helicase RecQ
MFLELLRWAEGGSCRHTAILRYFGTENPPDDCGRCDVCTELDADETQVDEVTLIVRKALSAVARVHGKFGLTLAAKLLRGDKDPRIEGSGLDKVSTFGILRDRPLPWLISLLRRCVTAGWVAFSGGDRPILFLTHEGQHAMRGTKPIRMRLPPVRIPSGRPSDRFDAERGPGQKTPSGGRRPDPDTQVASADAALFEALRAHRLAVARESGAMPYVVASDRSLRDLCAQKPKNLAELLDVYGFGETRAERYGPGLLEVIAKFRR